MKISKINCPLDINGKPDSVACHNALILANPTLIQVKHTPNNHILLFTGDFDQNGSHSNDIHELAKAFSESGGVVNAKALAAAAKLGVSLN